MIFETERLYVTKWKPKDLYSLHELYNDPAIKALIQPTLTLEETRSIFERQLDHYSRNIPFGRYFIVEKATGKFVGLLLLKNGLEAASVEIGYSIIKECWKKGYATEIVKESIPWLFDTRGFTSIFGITAGNNENSKNVLVKCGFVAGETFVENDEEMNIFSLLKEDVLV
jgi:[ribosomal protein S5]-alanine N-acetyltransferase